MHTWSDWYQRVKRWALIGGYVVMVAFTITWIYNYDVCIRGPDGVGAGPVGCLLMSAFVTYFAWWIVAIVWVIKLIYGVL